MSAGQASGSEPNSLAVPFPVPSVDLFVPQRTASLHDGGAGLFAEVDRWTASYEKRMRHVCSATILTGSDETESSNPHPIQHLVVLTWRHGCTSWVRLAHRPTCLIGRGKDDGHQRRRDTAQQLKWRNLHRAPPRPPLPSSSSWPCGVGAALFHSVSADGCLNNRKRHGSRLFSRVRH